MKEKDHITDNQRILFPIIQKFLCPVFIARVTGKRLPPVKGVERCCLFLSDEEMKKIDLPLSQLSLAEKLNLMEALWADLSRDEKKLKSPAWYETCSRISGKPS